MNYTYLAIVGAVILIFLSVYFFTAEKSASLFNDYDYFLWPPEEIVDPRNVEVYKRKAGISYAIRKSKCY